MHHITPGSLTKTLEDLSPARLSSYRAFFNPASDEALYGLYCWNEALSNSLMRLIGVLEISLRNKLHTALSSRMWVPGTSIGTKSSNDWYNWVKLNRKSEELVFKITHDVVYHNGQKTFVPKAFPPSPGQVISRLTYGFWPRLLDLTHDKAGNLIVWGQLLPQVIPDHHQKTAAYWTTKAHQDHIYARLDMIAGLRNRIAHFEPIWKLNDLKEEKRKRHGVTVNVVQAAPLTPQDAITRLELLFKRTNQMLHWLSKERAADFAASEANHIATYLLSKNALDRYQKMQPIKNARLSGISKSWGMKLILRENTPIVIYDNQQAIGRYYPYSTQ